jgi:cytochrome c peroxidase
MHDGRLATLEQMLDHYASGVEKNATVVDPLLLKNGQKGIVMTALE